MMERILFLHLFREKALIFQRFLACGTDGTDRTDTIFLKYKINKIYKKEYIKKQVGVLSVPSVPGP